MLSFHFLTIIYSDIYCTVFTVFIFKLTFAVAISFFESCFYKSQITLILVTYTKNLLSSGQDFLTLQLYPTFLFLGVRICLLWLDIIDFMFLVHLQLIFMVFFLNTFDNGSAIEKCFFQHLEKQFSNVGFSTQKKGWIKPYDLPFLLLHFFISSLLLSIFVFIFQFFIKTTLAYCFFISGFLQSKKYLDYMTHGIKLSIKSITQQNLLRNDLASCSLY